MANELKIKAEISYNPSTDELSGTGSGAREFFVDMSGADYSQGTQEIGTSEEQIVVSAEIGTQGWWMIKNTDDTNFVTVGGTGSLAMKIKPGETILYRASEAQYAQADTAAVTIEFLCFED